MNKRVIISKSKRNFTKTLINGGFLMFIKLYRKIKSFTEEVGKDHVGAYSAQSAYFFILSMIPIILLLLTLVQYTPLTKADVMTGVVQVFPSSVNSMMVSIVNQVYNQSAGIIPITVIVALWSAGRGVLAVTSGLNCIQNCEETRNYIFLRLRATLYTVLFIVIILFLLLLSVFGNRLNLFIATHIHILVPLSNWMLERRIFITCITLIGFFLVVYMFLPNKKNRLVLQIPGAVCAAVGWMIVSWVFSIYVDVFKGFSSMYGSLTTIVLIMLWLYFCMYSILLGAEVNKIYDRFSSENFGKAKKMKK